MTVPVFTTRPMVYLAGPYTIPDPVTNTSLAIKNASFMIEEGFMVVVPHLTLAWNLVVPQPPEFWYAYDFAMLARCDALYRMFGESVGADAEVDFANRMNIPCFMQWEPLIEWRDSWEYDPEEEARRDFERRMP
jgi:hypothetical protein